MSNLKKAIPINVGRVGGASSAHVGKGTLPKPFYRAVTYDPAWDPNTQAVSAAFTYGDPFYLPLPDLGDLFWETNILGGNTGQFGYSIGHGGDPTYTVISHPSLIVGPDLYVSSISQSGTTLHLDSGPTKVTALSDYKCPTVFGSSASFSGGKSVFNYIVDDPLRFSNHQKMAVFRGTTVGSVYDLSAIFGADYGVFDNLSFRNTSYGILNLVNLGPVTNSRIVLYRVNDDLTVDFLDNISGVNTGGYIFWDYGHVVLSGTACSIQGLNGTNSAYSIVTRSGDSISVGPPNISTQSPTLGFQYIIRLDDNHYVGVVNSQAFGFSVSGTTITDVGTPFSLGVSGADYFARFSPDPSKIVGWASDNFGGIFTGPQIWGVSGGNITQSYGSEISPIVDNYFTQFDCVKANSNEMIMVGGIRNIDAFVPPTAKDSSGNGYDAHYDDYGTWDDPGMIPGGGCSWSGSLTGPLPNGYTFDGSFGLDFWYKFGGTDWLGVSNPTFTDSFEVYILWTPEGGALKFERLFVSPFGAGLESFISNSFVVPTDRNPHHLAVTYTPPSIDSTEVHFYVDGVEVGLGSGTGLGVDSVMYPLSEYSLYGFSDSEGIGGLDFIDEYALYDHALTPTEVATHYAARTSQSSYSSAVAASHPLVYLHLDERLIGAGSGPHQAATGSAKDPKMRKVSEKVRMKA